MIGFYDYTVVLTYLSLLSAGAGIVIALSGGGHPYIGCFFLLFCGLCDAFDGKVARTKRGRTKMEQNFGIQIDSLSDIVAFGVLPACIGAAVIRTSPQLQVAVRDHAVSWQMGLGAFLMHAVLVLYILAALIRLAYFNVTEEERQSKEDGTRKYYTGLPVTAASLIFPAVMLFQYILPADISLVYLAIIVLTGFLFLFRFQVRKPGTRGILIMVALGALEFALLLCWRLLAQS